MNWDHDGDIEDRLFKRDIKSLGELNDKILERVIREVKRLDNEAVSTADEKAISVLLTN
jgi:hypothetical protein